MPGREDLDAERTWNIAEVLSVEGHQCVRPTVDRRFEDHLVGWIAELGSPQEPTLDGFADSAERRDDRADLGLGEPGGDALGGSLQIASYSSTSGTDRSRVNWRSNACSTNAAEAPEGLLSAATTTLVSRTRRIQKDMISRAA